MTLIAIGLFLFGLLIGSFLNVVIHRLPREESIVFPASHCPVCRNAIRWYENIPVASYILLKGRCRTCRTRIPLRYPLVELLNGAGYLFLFYRFGWGWSLLPFSIFCSALLAITFIDLSHQIVPDVITYPGMAAGLIFSSTLLPAGFFNALTGLLLGGGLFYLVAFLSNGGMGGGDVKLIAMIGAFTGWKAVLLTIFISALSGSVTGIILMLFFGKGRKFPVPFGPFLALGALCSVFWGEKIIYWYSRLGT